MFVYIGLILLGLCAGYTAKRGQFVGTLFVGIVVTLVMVTLPEGYRFTSATLMIGVMLGLFS